MECVICKGGQTRPGRTAVTLERETTTLVFKAVPGEVWANCGEAYVAEEISRQILAAPELAARSGVRVGVREFVGVRRKEARLGAGGAGSPT
jgi:YgiT-type zinc finger domain-containing protein